MLFGASSNVAWTLDARQDSNQGIQGILQVAEVLSNSMRCQANSPSICFEVEVFCIRLDLTSCYTFRDTDIGHQLDKG